MSLPLKPTSLGVLETILPVVADSHYVHIDPNALGCFCRTLVERGMSIPPWDSKYHFSEATERTVAYLLILDSLNFCFWGKPRWEIEYKGEWLLGYWALAASLKKAMEKGIPLTRAEYLERISQEEVRDLFAGRGEIPLLPSRHHIMQETGSVLREKYGSQAFHLVDSAGKSATELVHLLIRDFPSFRDEAFFQGQKVCFYKRAQILVADLYGCFRGKAWGEFADIDFLTACADYKLPQVLRHLGILKYSSPLARKVDSQEPLCAGSRAEIEIRANTLWAVELMKGDLQQRGIVLHSFEIDWLLWDWGQKEEFKRVSQPYHRTLTIYY